MAKDFAFMFYPGEYLRDTQCLSEPVQVAYDRIMCEHMRNICITQAQLNFFTKKLTEEQKDELLLLLTKIKGGYQIEWVTVSICKRKAYSESRSKNRTTKDKNISSTYDAHMVDINKDVIVNKELNNNEGVISENEVIQTIELLDRISRKKLSIKQVNNYWQAFLIHSEKEFYSSRSKKIQHFRNWLKQQKFETEKSFV